MVCIAERVALRDFGNVRSERLTQSIGVDGIGKYRATTI